MQLTLHPAMFSADGQLLAQDLKDAIVFEVKGLPAAHYAQVESPRGGAWELKWSNPTRKLSSVGIFDTREQALEALRHALTHPPDGR